MTLVVHLEGAAPGAVVSLVIDGVHVPQAAMREVHNANPGTHELSARVEGGVAVTTTLEAKEGETREVTLTLPPPPVVHAELPKNFEPHAEPKRSRNGVATAAFALGGLGLVVGTFTGLLAMSKKSDSRLGVQRAEAVRRQLGRRSRLGEVVGDVLPRSHSSPVGSARRSASSRIFASRPDDAPREGASLYLGPGTVGLHGAF